jgi:outer membrane protein OmpU
MKKTLIAAAVTTAFAGSAMAQVTVSGKLDYGYSDVKSTSTANVTTKTSSGVGDQQSGWDSSRINFGATEDLGGGMKAGMQIQQGLSTATTTNRDTFVFVEGGFGRLQVGFQDPAIQSAFGGFGVTGTTNGAGTLDSGSHDVLSGDFGTGSFTRQNGVRYQSPSFNGFTAAVDYSNDAVSVSDVSGKNGADMHAVTLNYKAGPLSFVVASGQVKTKIAATNGVTGQAWFFNSTSNFTLSQTTATTSVAGQAANVAQYAGAAAQATGVTPFGIVTSAGTTAVASSERKAKLNIVGAAYDFGVANVKASYVTRKDDTAGAQQSDISGYTVGLNVPIGNLRLFASAYDASDDRTTAATDDRDLKGNQFGLTYSFSKRTLAYLYTGKNEATVNSTGANAASKIEGTYFGLSHTF